MSRPASIRSILYTTSHTLFLQHTGITMCFLQLFGISLSVTLITFAFYESTLLYLRELGEIGQKYGCSVVLCHIHHARRRGVYLLNTANTGLGEAILCRGGRAIPLTTTHSPATNPSERTRIIEAKGFISQVRLTL